ncbi:uncharacterized protein LOC131858366 [Cryptomeria japonica]|uniref:uncharacterized protein LOC131858366 n=1 Tax=Cryptomeria japonica TaxID=3369 RepID=UPI0027DA5919|nr:uncharacterized protein LOC131858366 [Cryptomeria japonica]
MGHCARQCPNKKNKDNKKKKVLATTEVDEFTLRFENDFSLISSLSSSPANKVWYIDSGASCYMTGVKECFRKLEEKKNDFYIDLRDKSKNHATGVGTVKFQRESGKPLFVEDVLYVPGMTKHLILVSTLEDKGYIITFEKGKVYIHPKDYKVAK